MTTSLTIVMLAIAAAGVGVIVSRRRADRLQLRVIALALGVMAWMTVGALALGVLVGLNLFGVAHLLYLVATVAAPAVGVAVLLMGSLRSMDAMGWAVGIVLLVPAPVGFYATHVEPNQLQVERLQVAVDVERDGEDPLRIAVLADLQSDHVGPHERAAVQAVLDARPDVILIPGDLFQGEDEQLRRAGPSFRQLLGRLQAPGGVYFVQGDSDDPHRLAAILPEAGITTLDGDVRRIQVGDRSLLLGGHPVDVDGPAAQRARARLAAERRPGDITVLVAHRPDTVLRLPADVGIDLVVAGHTHGGQIAIPGFGPLVTLSNVPRRIAAGGVGEVDGNRIYVSRGVGMERQQAPQIRFLVPPTIGVVDLVG